MQPPTASHTDDLIRQALETLACINDDATGLALELSLASEAGTVPVQAAAAIRARVVHMARQLRAGCQRCRATLGNPVET